MRRYSESFWQYCMAIGITGYIAFDSMLKDMTAEFIVQKDISLVVLKDSPLLAMKDVKDTDIVGMQNACFQDSVELMTEEMEKGNQFLVIDLGTEAIRVICKFAEGV